MPCYNKCKKAYKVGEKMTGILVVNAYLTGEKFTQLHHHLQNTAAAGGISLQIKTNEEMRFSDETPDFILFWDKDILLAKQLEARHLPVFNSADAIALCDDKAKTFLALDGVVPQPETIPAPLSYGGADYTAFVRQAAARLGYPLVFKECCGSFGAQVFLCHEEADVLAHISEKPFLLQAFIAEAAGEDVRIEVVDGICVAAMKRRNTADFRANLTNGGVAELYTPRAEEQALATKACEALGLTFGGVDILNGNIVCEVNSNAHIMHLKDCTGIDVAPLIFEAIKRKL